MRKRAFLEAVLRAELNRMKSVFSKFNDSLFALNHSATLISSMFITSNNLSKEVCEKNTLVSSANRMNVKMDEIEAKSLIYNRNNRGPSIEPGGTPHVISVAWETTPLKQTYCLLLCK